MYLPLRSDHGAEGIKASLHSAKPRFSQKASPMEVDEQGRWLVVSKDTTSLCRLSTTNGLIGLPSPIFVCKRKLVTGVRREEGWKGLDRRSGHGYIEGFPRPLSSVYTGIHPPSGSRTPEPLRWENLRYYRSLVGVIEVTPVCI